MVSPASVDRIGGRRRWSRWGLLLTTLALAVALLGSAWVGYRGAKDAVDALDRGQAEMLAGALRGGTFGAWERAQMGNRGRLDRVRGDTLSPDAPEATGSAPGRAFRRYDVTHAEIAAAMDSVVIDRYEAGLRWVGFLSVDDEVLASGGEPSDVPLHIPSSRDRPALVRQDRRVRAYFIPPGDVRSSRPTLVLEFEPVVARAMLSRAVRSLLLATIVAGSLTVAGFMFWRLSLRFEAAERLLEEQRRLSVLGEMSAVLAHEIRNPLASLKGHAQLLVERLAGPSDERKKAERVVSEATRLEALTSDLLDFAGSGPLHIEDIDPLELVRTSAADAVLDAAVTVEASTAPSRWPLDGRRLRQALVNLIRNAAQASPPEVPPNVAVAEEDNRLVIDVRDHGEGLPTGQEDRVFDPFFTTRTTGTGLGLPVAKRIVELHGGRLTATNAPGGGAVFRIEIPRTP